MNLGFYPITFVGFFTIVKRWFCWRCCTSNGGMVLNSWTRSILKIWLLWLISCRGHVQGIIQLYNCIRLCRLVVNQSSVKNLLRKSSVTKDFSLYKTQIFYFTSILCGTVLFFNTWIFPIWSFRNLHFYEILTNFYELFSQNTSILGMYSLHYITWISFIQR